MEKNTLKPYHKTCLRYLVVFLVFSCVSGTSYSATYFHGTGLLDTPTAYIMDNGLFDAGADFVIKDQKRQEMSVRMDFGLLNFAELGIVGLKRDENDYIMGNAKVILTKEEGALPSFAVGIDNFGENVNDDSKEYDTSFYAVISKQFNLPFLHIINGHLGIGNKRFIDEDSIGKYLHGGFLGLSKELVLTSRDIRLTFAGELKGKGVNIGLKYLMKSGVIVNLAIAQLGSDEGSLSYHFGISFINAPLMKEIAQSMELAKQAVRIANENNSKTNEDQKAD